MFCFILDLKASIDAFSEYYPSPEVILLNQFSATCLSIEISDQVGFQPNIPEIGYMCKYKGIPIFVCSLKDCDYRIISGDVSVPFKVKDITTSELLEFKNKSK